MPSLFALPELRESLTEIVLASPAVPRARRSAQRFQPFLDAFFDGLGEKAEEVLSANLERAGARLVRLVAAEQGATWRSPRSARS